MKVLLTIYITATILTLPTQARESLPVPTPSELEDAHPEFDPGEMDRPYIRKAHPEFDPGEMDRPYIRENNSSVSELSSKTWKPERPENNGSSGAYGPWGDHNKWPQPNIPASVHLDTKDDLTPYSASLKKSLNQAINFASKPDIKIQVVIVATTGLTIFQILKNSLLKKGRVAFSLVPAPLLVALIGSQRVIEIPKHDSYSFSDVEEFAGLSASEQKKEWSANQKFAKYVIQVLEQIKLKQFATENNLGGGI